MLQNVDGEKKTVAFNEKNLQHLSSPLAAIPVECCGQLRRQIFDCDLPNLCPVRVGDFPTLPTLLGLIFRGAAMKTKRKNVRCLGGNDSICRTAGPSSASAPLLSDRFGFLGFGCEKHFVRACSHICQLISVRGACIVGIAHPPAVCAPLPGLLRVRVLRRRWARVGDHARCGRGVEAGI